MPTNDIGQDRFQRRLTKELRIKGSMPAPVLAPEIQPVIIVEDERPENLMLQHERRFACSLTLGAVVNEYYYFQLNNPAGRNQIIVIEEFGISRPGAGEAFGFGFADPAVTASLGARDMYCLDTRIPGVNPRAGTGQNLVGTDLGAGLINVFGRVSVLQGDTVTVRPNVVLTPGHGFSIWKVLPNGDVAGWCIWRERRAEDGELT